MALFNGTNVTTVFALLGYNKHTFNYPIRCGRMVEIALYNYVCIFVILFSGSIKYHPLIYTTPVTYDTSQIIKPRRSRTRAPIKRIQSMKHHLCETQQREIFNKLLSCTFFNNTHELIQLHFNSSYQRAILQT